MKHANKQIIRERSQISRVLVKRLVAVDLGTNALGELNIPLNRHVWIPTLAAVSADCEAFIQT